MKKTNNKIRQTIQAVVLSLSLLSIVAPNVVEAKQQTAYEAPVKPPKVKPIKCYKNPPVYRQRCRF